MTEETKSVHWHALDAEAVFERLDSGADGLDEAQAKQRLEHAGPNSLETEDGVSPLRLLARQVHNPLIYLLIGAAVLSFVIGHRVDAAVIAGVVVLNTLLGFIQEWRAEGALAALQEMSAPHSRVLRDGKPRRLEAREVVPGDVLVLETGDRVAADARLLSGDDLQVDESALTGESDPLAKAPGQVDEGASVADRGNMVWMSTNVTGGRGRAIVIATGMDTQMGRIAEKVRSTGRQETPLQKRLKKLGLALGIIGIALAGVVFVLGVLRGHGVVEMLLFAVAVAVSAIPEGLPAVISITLALGVRRMANRHAIIRRLSAVETLGSTTVICSDKTGTITENQMTVRRLWADGQTYEVSGDGYRPEGELRREGGETVGERPDTLERLLWIGTLSNNADLKEKDGQWRVEGNPSEGALLAVAIKAGMEIGPMREERRRLAEVPFSSDAKYMATLHPDQDGAGRVAYVKGAPERILGFCSHVLRDGESVELNDDLRREIREISERYASEALRVMAGAYREMPQDQDGLEPTDVENGLTLAGLWGMFDPPRKESTQAVSDAKGAGIHPVMITGDHAITALAIARQVGITEDGPVLTGADIERMEKPELAKAALAGGVFARVSPAHKLKLMEALQEQGHVVAMTGDGVNDAPALKGADIGIAMGRAGTEVAKEAADMVLTDDNFATIVDAVEEGRVIYNNLRGVVFFLLCANAGEILTLFGALVLGLDLPMTATMILWVNLVTAGACTIPLGIEPRHADVLRERPRDPQEPVVNRVMLRRMAILTPLMALGTLLLFQSRSGTDFVRAQTVAFTAMVAFEWFQALNARSQRLSIFAIGPFSNRWLLLGVGVAILLQLGAVHTPVGRTLLGTTALSWMDWLLIVLISSSVWLVDEIMKWLGVYGKPQRSL
ncbi:cation-translocating P-type ATPase [Anaerobaca lacustris]|uniref:HAD-IC family P-type ATPase n=1 Tax=Anaerobaca lacustris TaxID=3044600 RepID=A0AAW6U144_9BACT|nr:HAD-IC family P-type ATPase [Sedimentisphaerales bacterium M17dextr]